LVTCLSLTQTIAQSQRISRIGWAASLALGGALLSATETLHALGLGWDHPAGYFALCAALTIVFSVSVGVVLGTWSRLRSWVIPIWVGATVGILEGGLLGILAVFGLMLVRQLIGPVRTRPTTESVVGAGVLAWSLILVSDAAQAFPEPIRPFAQGKGGLVVAFLLAGTGLAWVAGRLWGRSLVLRNAVLCLLILIPATASFFLTARSPYTRVQAGPAPEQQADGPSVLLIVLDTVGARHLPLYGYGRSTVPGLERFLEQRDNAVVFPLAFANSPWTSPSHVSLITGVIPSDHGVHYTGDPDGQYPLDLDVDATLPELLRAAGYRTVGVFANWLGMIRGFSRGFVLFAQPVFPERLPLLGEKLRKKLLPGVFAEARKPYPDAARVTRAVEQELDACEARACFLFVNYLDAHAPYIPSEECRGRFGPPWTPLERADRRVSVRESPERLEHLATRHDEEICGLDNALTELLQTLERRGFLDRGWVIITSDHGEAFGEHGAVEHGSSVYNEQTHIPLIVLPPSGTRVRPIEEPVSLTDLTATISEITGVKKLGAGKSLLAEAADRDAPIEFFGAPHYASRKGTIAGLAASAVVVGEHKLIRMNGELLLFDLGEDPGEQVDLSSRSPQLVQSLSLRLPPLRAATGVRRTTEKDLSRQERERLRELGYLE
jgi:arylsulfatase A-like enzyme